MNSIIGVMIATMVALMIVPRYFAMVANGTTQAVRATTAGQLQALLKGAEQYINNHNADLTASVPVGGVAAIDIATLISENDLPSGFATENPYRQNWAVYVRQPASGTLNALIESSGGDTLASNDSVAIASLTGAQGGFVPQDGDFGSMSASNAYGASGSWQLSLSGLPNPGAGHLVGLVTAAGATTTTTSDYLYRDAVANHPEYNEMRTALSMGGNDINDADNVNATRGVFAEGNPNGGYGGVQVGTAYLYGDSANAAIRTPGMVYMQHYDGAAADLSAGGGTFAGNVGTSGYGPYSGIPTGWGGGVHTFDVYSEGSVGVGTGGTVNSYLNSAGDGRIGATLDVQDSVTVDNMGCNVSVSSACFYGDSENAAIRMPGTFVVQHTDGSTADVDAANVSATTVKLGTADGQAYATWSCDQNGTIAASATGSGVILSCQSNVWRPIAQLSSYVGPTTTGFTGYSEKNTITGGYSCPAGTGDLNIETIWYGDNGYDSLHLCSAE